MKEESTVVEDGGAAFGRVGVKFAIASQLLSADGQHFKAAARLIDAIKEAGGDPSSEVEDGSRRMRYTPSMMLAARAAMHGTTVAEVHKAMDSSEKMPRVIVTRMTKGGVGKTTMACNLALAMALTGYRVLFIDTDPQANSTNMFGITTAEGRRHIGELMLRPTQKPDADLHELIIPVLEDGYLDLIPADVTMDQVNAQLLGQMTAITTAELVLRRNIKVLSKYDVIFVDTMPGTTPLSNAFTYAAHTSGKLLTVVEPEGACLRALDSLKNNLEHIEASMNKHIEPRIIINKFAAGRKHVDKNVTLLYEAFQRLIYPGFIPSSTAFSLQINADAIKESRPLLLGNPLTPAAQALIAMMHAVIQDFQVVQPGLDGPVVGHGKSARSTGKKEKVV